MKRLISATHISFLLFWLVACSRALSTGSTSLRPTPPPLPLTWNTDPKTRTVLATFCCDGPATEELVRPYIPEAQIWGDGRFLWTEQDANGVRQVMVKQLTADDMAEVLHEIAVSGFFDWDEQYVGEPVVDAASQCMTVTLADLTKKVCTANGSAPDSFSALFVWLSQGADMSGMLYWPERAYLTGFQLVDTVTSLSEPEVAWPENLASVPIDEAVTGFWLDEGETLRLLWEATNRNLYHMPVVRKGDSRYRIILQVPGVSWIEP